MMSYGDYSKPGFHQNRLTETRKSHKKQKTKRKRNRKRYLGGRSVAHSATKAVPKLEPPLVSTVASSSLRTRRVSKFDVGKRLAEFGKSSFQLIKRSGSLAFSLARSTNMLAPTPIRLQAMLSRMGVTFQKLGQFLSNTISDPDYRETLKSCLSDNPPLTARQFSKTLRKRLKEAGLPGVKVLKIGKHLGTGSIAEVRKALIEINGEEKEVVVKVLKPGVKGQLQADRKLLKILMRLGSVVAPTLLNRHIAGAMDDFMKTMELESDFRVEAENARRMANYIDEHREDFPDVDVARPVEGAVGPGVLMMDEVKGQPLVKVEKDDQQYSRGRAMACWQQCLEETGFFHADAHDGNLMVTNNKVVFVDFGNCGQLTKMQIAACKQFGLAVQTKDALMLATALMQLGQTTVEPEQLEQMAEQLKPLMEGKEYSDLLSMINIGGNFGIHCPGEIIALLKHRFYTQIDVIEMEALEQNPPQNWLVKQPVSAGDMQKYLEAFHWEEDNPSEEANRMLAQHQLYAESLGFETLENFYQYLGEHLEPLNTGHPRASRGIQQMFANAPGYRANPQDLFNKLNCKNWQEIYDNCYIFRQYLSLASTAHERIETEPEDETETWFTPQNSDYLKQDHTELIFELLKTVESGLINKFGSSADLPTKFRHFLTKVYRPLYADNPANEAKLWDMISSTFTEAEVKQLKANYEGKPWQKLNQDFEEFYQLIKRFNSLI